MRKLLSASALVVALVLGVAGDASAQIPGPGTSQLLAILAELQRLQSTVSHIRAVTSDLKTKVYSVYPDRVIRSIGVYFLPALSLKREIEQLSCDWRFSPVMDRFRLGVLGGGSFCREEWEGVFGRAPVTVNRDLDEYQEMMSVQRLGAVRGAVEGSDEWAGTAHWLMTETLAGTPLGDPSLKYSPGYSNRLSALGAAQLGNFMVQSGKLEAYSLDLSQERLNVSLKRRRDEATVSLGMFSLLANRGLDGEELQ
jgi:hypothetical protein